MMQPDERENGGSGTDPREIYYHENHESARPWWDVPSYFLGPVKFGKWDGVFVSIIINIFGAVLFLQGQFSSCLEFVQNSIFQVGLLLVFLG